MTAKKRWLPRICTDLKDGKRTQNLNISWSCSDSDEDDELTLSRSKKIKLTNNDDKNEEYMQSHNSLLDNSSDSLYNNANSDETTYGELINNCKEHESPIIGVHLETELSPVVTESLAADSSPILSAKCRSKIANLKHKIRNKFKSINRSVACTSQESPELFSSQSSSTINSDSPDLNNIAEFNTNHENIDTCYIEPFPSQHSSQIINSSCEANSSKSDPNLLYHLPPPKKKGHKPGGLAYSLQKALKLQKTRASIWQHEVFANRTNNDVYICEGNIILFTLLGEFKEYGNTVLECKDYVNIDYNELCEPEKNGTTFLILLGFNVQFNISFQVGCHYKLIPPFSKDTVNYKLRSIVCYFNISKLTILEPTTT